jgi:hypothetical protein
MPLKVLVLPPYVFFDVIAAQCPFPNLEQIFFIGINAGQLGIDAVERIAVTRNPKMAQMIFLYFPQSVVCLFGL